MKATQMLNRLRLRLAFGNVHSLDKCLVVLPMDPAQAGPTPIHLCNLPHLSISFFQPNPGSYNPPTPRDRQSLNNRVSKNIVPIVLMYRLALMFRSLLFLLPYMFLFLCIL